MFSNNQAELECVVSGQDNDIVSGTEITWEINGELMRSKIKEATMFEGSKHSITTFNSSDWRTVSKVRCSAVAEDVGPVIQDLTVNKGGMLLINRADNRGDVEFRWPAYVVHCKNIYAS